MFTSSLEDLDYAGDLALLANNHQDIQEKSNKLNQAAKDIGLYINVNKTKVILINNRNNYLVDIDEENLEDVDAFTHLGAVLSKHGGTQKDIRIRLYLARVAFVTLKQLWKSINDSTKTKLKVFKSNVVTVLLYGAELWRLTREDKKICKIFQRTLILNKNFKDTLANETI